ncbi:MAG: hypothetical protein KC503_34485 [Myxococcales bacterium]|nr:hypothetical protein [Myxococcales bacterium]
MTTIRTTPALLATLLAALLCAPPASAAPSERHISVRAGSRRVRATLLTRHQLNQFAGDKTPLIAETTKALQRKNSKGTKRGFHGAPALGTAVVSLDPHAGIDKGLRDMLARGIFGDAQKGFMRFSTGNPNAKEVPQWVPDVRGIGIALPGGNLSATNQPAQIVARGIDFLNFFHGTFGPLGAPFRWNKLSPKTALRGLGRLLVGTQPVPDLLRTRYWGYPTVIGSDGNGGLVVARTVFTPVGRDVIGKGTLSRIANGAKTIAKNLFNPKFQSKKLSQALATSDVKFEVGVQLYRDPKSTPMTADGDKAWNVPVIPIATLTLPKQQHDAQLAQQIESKGSFGPQITHNSKTLRPGQVPNEPAGQFQTDRVSAYEVSSGARGAAPAGNIKILESLGDR